jgi:hypothetical protein
MEFFVLEANATKDQLMFHFVEQHVLKHSNINSRLSKMQLGIKMRSNLLLSTCLILLMTLAASTTSSVTCSAVGISSFRTPASESPIDTGSEYSNGSIPMTPYGSIWYTWINTTDTQIISYALFSDQVNSPIINLLGQHFQLQDGTEVFVGNTLALIEVYNDTSGDGIPQANFTSGISEIEYYLLVNSSIGYEISPIQKIMEGEIAHYKWGFTYEGIDGFLFYSEEQWSVAATVMIDQLGFNYDFYVVDNVATIKPSFDIGNVTAEFVGEETASLDQLSLSLLFDTAIFSPEQCTTHVNGQAYNSTTTTESAIPIDSGQIAVNTIKAYEFLFGENYNLTRGENIETYQAKNEAAATTSVPEGATSHLDTVLNCFEENLNITDLFDMEGQINLNCNFSTLLYRICYPVWDGMEIQHDPTYVAYLFSDEIIPEFAIAWIPSLLVLDSLLSIFATKVGKWRKPVLRKH